jgi:DNA-binding NarL/FixJ family response regulator
VQAQPSFRGSAGKTNQETPRVLLADDHALLLEAFERLLSPACYVVGLALDGRSLLDQALKVKPDVIVADISMPLLNGIDACRQLQLRLPETRWVFLTVNADPDMAVEAFRVGGSAYVLKSSAASELFTAIQQVLRGLPYITPLVAKGVPLPVFLSRRVHTEEDKLTIRQREVLQLLAEGRGMKEVADVLGVTPRTVAFHKYTMMQELSVKTSAELVQYAVKRGLVRP